MLLKDIIMKCKNIGYWTYLILKVKDKTVYAGYFKDMPYRYSYYKFKSFEVIDIGVEIVLEWLKWQFMTFFVIAVQLIVRHMLPLRLLILIRLFGEDYSEIYQKSRI